VSPLRAAEETPRANPSRDVYSAAVCVKTMYIPTDNNNNDNIILLYTCCVCVVYNVLRPTERSRGTLHCAAPPPFARFSWVVYNALAAFGNVVKFVVDINSIVVASLCGPRIVLATIGAAAGFILHASSDYSVDRVIIPTVNPKVGVPPKIGGWR